MKYAELFAGAGGLSRGLDAVGWECVAHAEINPHARAVLRYRYPDTRLDGDVSLIDGRDYKGIDLLSGGSPCQDLSVAGKRAGLGGTRSGLFYQQIRIWNESGAPYLLWENVPGALSSNSGKDFAAVLSAIVGSPVAVPADGWRGGGGVVAGRDAVAAWRVLDLQHFGPPQRRARVFVLGARTGGVDPAEVLSLSEGVCGHPSPREYAREDAARGAEAGADAWSVNNDSRAEFIAGGVAPLRAGHRQQPVAFNWQAGGSRDHVQPTPETSALSVGQVPAVMAFTTTQTPKVASEDGVTHTLEAGSKSGGGQPLAVLCATGPVTHALTHEGADASEDGTGRGTPIVVGFAHVGHSEYSESSTTLRAAGGDLGGGSELLVVASGQAGAEIVEGGAPTLTCQHEAPYVVGTLDVHDATEWGSHQWVAQDKCVAAGRPRRLTPKECERLMSWPDDWTRWGVLTADDYLAVTGEGKTEKQRRRIAATAEALRRNGGKRYELSDTQRYRLCGNGVGSVCVQWIAQRLIDAERAA
jgi:DNA (cytosine-5)-methyltransferase 1